MLKGTKGSSSGNKSLSMYFSHTADLSKKALLDRHSKHSYSKKSSSLPIYYLNRDRIKEITEVYRSISTDKLATHTPKTRRNSPSLVSDKHKTPFSPIHSNFIVEAKQKPKLTLQRGRENASQANPEPSGSWAQLAIKLRSLTDRLQELLATKSEEYFMQGFEKFMQGL
jgi:hypothetical protein